MDSDINDLNSFLDDFNKGLERITRELKRENKRKEIKKRLGVVAEEMRKKGASEHSVRTALLGTYEFLKVSLGVTLEKSDEGMLKDPEKTLEPNKEAPGTVLSDVAIRQIDWLWQRRIPLGKITLLDGDPGMGKSLLAINIAACVSTGRPMPDDSPGRQGSVVLIAPEDSAEDTIKPRMEAAGGDPSQMLLLDYIEGVYVQDVKKFHIYDRPFSLSHDLDILEEAVMKTKAILVILDPLMAILGRNIDSSRDQDVREIFTPLAQLAERTGCAILIIRHLNKGTSDNMLYRGAGTIGIIAAARTALLVAHDPDDEQKRVFATTKNNLSKIAPNLTYQVVENERGVPYIQWLGENHHITSTLLRPGTTLSFGRQEILRVLQEASGPLDAKEIAEHTGLKYSLLRQTLSRMRDARVIISPYRGKFTTPDHPSITRKSADTDTAGELPTNGERSDAGSVGARFIAPWGGVGQPPSSSPAVPDTSDTSDTNDTNDTNDTKPAHDLDSPAD